MTMRLVGADDKTGKLPDLVLADLTKRFPTDTGSRQLAGSGLTLPANTTVTAWKLRRSGSTVELFFRITNTGTTSANVTFGGDWLPAGFRPAEQRLFGHSVNGGSVTGILAVNPNGAVVSYTVPAGASDQASIVWMTGEAFPSTLPGSAA